MNNSMGGIILKLKRFVLFTGCLLFYTILGAVESFDVNRIVNINSIEQKQEILKDALSNIILQGDMKSSHIALAVVIYGKHKEFIPEIQKKLAMLTESIDDMKLKAVALHALASITDDDLSDQLIPLLNHHNGKVRQAALDATQEAQVTGKLRESLKERLNFESAPEIRSRVLRDLYKFDSENKDIYITKLQSMAESPETNTNINAIAMLSELGAVPVSRKSTVKMSASEQRKKDISDALSGRNVTDENLMTMLMSGSHALRIEAVELAAQKGSPAMQQFIMNAGKTNVLHHRLASAYFLYFQKNKKEALERLKIEKNPMVQALLIGTLIEAGEE